MEVERRWLVDPSAVGDLANIPYRLIEDLYVGASRLRLRKITDGSGNAVFKLGKKYGKQSALSEPITSLYLSEDEYRQLAGLPGCAVSKRRYTIAGGSLDVYQTPNASSMIFDHAGCMIFELEFDDDAAAGRFRPPPFVTREITGDPAFSGFALASEAAGMT
jgi:CYTH domain-containing protein